jgi:hypothetical protein
MKARRRRGGGGDTSDDDMTGQMYHTVICNSFFLCTTCLYYSSIRCRATSQSPPELVNVICNNDNTDTTTKTKPPRRLACRATQLFESRYERFVDRIPLAALVHRRALLSSAHRTATHRTATHRTATHRTATRRAAARRARCSEDAVHRTRQPRHLSHGVACCTRCIVFRV